MAFFCIILSITGRIHLVIEDQVAEEKKTAVADLVAVPVVGIDGC